MKHKGFQKLKRIVSGLLSLTMIMSMSAVLPANAEEENKQGADHYSYGEATGVLALRGGDVNGDGAVNSSDKELLNKWLVRLVGDNELDMENADVNMDGKVNIMDFVKLCKICKPESGSSDEEETFEQHIGEDSEILSEINTDDNAFKVSLDITASGDIQTSLSASESEYSSIIESDMVVGVVPEFECEEGCEIENAALNFNIKDSYIENTNGNYAAVSEDFEGIKRFNVFKYFEDIDMLLPIETTYDTDNNVITTNVDELGTYCLVDMEQWFENLGIEPEEFVTVNVSPSAVGMMAIPVRASALTSAANTVTTPIDVVFHPYAESETDQNKIEAGIMDTATRLFDEYGRNGNVRIYVANYRGTLGVTNLNINYAENEEDLQTILNRISCVPSSLPKKDLRYLGHLNNLMKEYLNNKRSIANRYYIFVEKMGINVNGTEDDITEKLDIHNMTAVMISPSPYDSVIKNTDGIRIEDKFDFCADVSNFIFGKNGKAGYKTILPTGWKEVALDEPITNAYKKVIDGITPASEFNSNNFADTDGDGLIDLKEIRYYFNGEDLIEWTPEGEVKNLPTIEKIRNLKAGKMYVKNALSQYHFWEWGRINDIRILPIKTDPTDKDTDHDDFIDSEDPKPMNYNIITIDDKLLDDSDSVNGKNPKITKDDIDKMIGHVDVGSAKMYSGDEVPESAKCYKNELIFRRTRKKDRTDGKFTITPSIDSFFAFTVTNTEETMSEEEYSTDDFNSTIKIFYKKGFIKKEEKQVKPVEIKHNENRTEITYSFILEKDIEYSIYVNNSTNNHEGEYSIHVSEDNWVYAPDGGLWEGIDDYYPSIGNEYYPTSEVYITPKLLVEATCGKIDNDYEIYTIYTENDINKVLPYINESNKSDVNSILSTIVSFGGVALLFVPEPSSKISYIILKVAGTSMTIIGGGTAGYSILEDLIINHITDLLIEGNMHIGYAMYEQSIVNRYFLWNTNCYISKINVTIPGIIKPVTYQKVQELCGLKNYDN